MVRINYVETPIHPICRNCRNFTFDTRVKPYGKSKQHKENVRCSLDGKQVKMNASCDLHTFQTK